MHINVGDRAKIKNNIPSVDGMLYKDTIVKIDHIVDNSKVRIIDEVGKIWYTNIDNIFLI